MRGNLYNRIKKIEEKSGESSRVINILDQMLLQSEGISYNPQLDGARVPELLKVLEKIKTKNPGAPHNL